jgi:hypothetical protein
MLPTILSYLERKSLRYCAGGNRTPFACQHLNQRVWVAARRACSAEWNAQCRWCVKNEPRDVPRRPQPPKRDCCTPEHGIKRRRLCRLLGTFHHHALSSRIRAMPRKPRVPGSGAPARPPRRMANTTKRAVPAKRPVRSMRATVLGGPVCAAHSRKLPHHLRLPGQPVNRCNIPLTTPLRRRGETHRVVERQGDARQAGYATVSLPLRREQAVASGARR